MTPRPEIISVIIRIRQNVDTCLLLLITVVNSLSSKLLHCWVALLIELESSTSAEKKMDFRI